ncbi:MAG: VWA domain-containing protein [Ghiorsea sp.]
MKHLLLSITILSLITACTPDAPINTTKGVYMLLDTSGTYTEELTKAQNIINYTLAKLNPGDTFAVARVDTASFSEKDLIAKATFDDRPSATNRQKRQFKEKVDHFVKDVKPSSYTDITGGILQGVEFLNEAKVGKKTILIFSDLKEELKKGYIRDIALQMPGYNVVALNVTKLRSDNVDPREYMNRLQMWEQRVEAGEGHWRVVNDMERLEAVIIE